MKLYKTNGELIADTAHETVKETVLYCIQNNISLRGANLRDANLSGADLIGANLCGANLRGANLRGADLRDADLYDADLRGADLRGANLRGANLRDAYLRDADLRDADLSGANLRGAYLRDADLRGAKDIIIFNKLGGRTCYAVQHENCLMIQAGCFWGTLDEFENACIEKYGNNEKENYSKQIAYLKSL